MIDRDRSQQPPHRGRVSRRKTVRKVALAARTGLARRRQSLRKKSGYSRKCATFAARNVQQWFVDRNW